VYKICCKDCDAFYVGQIKRHLKTRLKEHVKNTEMYPSKHSVIAEHIHKFNHEFDWDNTQILDFETNYNKRLISEMIYIKEQKKSINLQTDTEMLLIFVC